MRYTFFLLILLLVSFLFAGEDSMSTWRVMAGSALLENSSYKFLRELSDNYGGRLVGSRNNERAMDFLQSRLKKLGLQLRKEQFEIPGWKRGADQVRLVEPLQRTLRAVALGYVNQTPEFAAEVVYGGYGQQDSLVKKDLAGKIVVVEQGKPPKGIQPLRYEVIDWVAQAGGKAVLFANDKEHMQVLAGTGNFQGNPAAVPAFSVTREEGQWLKRLIENGQKPRVEVTVNSICQPTVTNNLVASLPGKKSAKIVVGAHFDSWDLGEGSIDNGLGTAILFEVARLLANFSPENYYTIDLVWFNGEELGLWGSKAFVKSHQADSILVMVNMDMTGLPTGINIMGFEELRPLMEAFLEKVNGMELPRGLWSRPWTNSDHQPFMLAGIPTVTPLAHLEKSMVQNYHDFGDTFDKANASYLAQAAAFMSVLTHYLANSRDFQFPRYEEGKLVEMLKQFKLDKRLKRQKEWKFAE